MFFLATQPNRRKGQSLRKEPERNKRSFGAPLRKKRYEILVKSFILIRKGQGTEEEHKQKLARVVTGPYYVIEIDMDTLVIARGEKLEMLSLDPTGSLPSLIEPVTVNSIRDALRSLDDNDAKLERGAIQHSRYVTNKV